MKPMLILSVALLAVARPAVADEPGAEEKTERSATPPARASHPISSEDETVHYALGARGRLLLVPGWMLSPFLKQYKTLTSGSVGLEFTRRKGALDIVTSLDLGFYAPEDGNFLGGDKDPQLDTHYTQFRGLQVLSLDVGFYWNHDFTSWLGFFIGGGVGIGVVFGDVYVINASSQLCNKDNAGDPSKCYPIAEDGTHIKPGDPDFQSKLDRTSQCVGSPEQCKDTAGHPHYHAASEKPPVVPVLNFIIGLRFKLHRHLNVNVSGGFRNGWVVGGGPEYVF